MDSYHDPAKVTEKASPELARLGIKSVPGVRVNTVSPELAGKGGFKVQPSPDLCHGATGYPSGGGRD